MATRLGANRVGPATVVPLVCGVSAMALIQPSAGNRSSSPTGRPAMATVTKVEKKRTDEGTVVDACTTSGPR